MARYRVKVIDSVITKDGFVARELLEIGPIFAILQGHPVFDDQIDYYDETEARNKWEKMKHSPKEG